ncbi:hypothetical protein CFOL_v3_23083 [Cephalotus follicularis]|uniref:Uncharacterized protein n=1 Tax=Cephalotus follicularis TaxID=3775 RepID=A0A1Q3CHC9_CEPFO|nr:hypothetical protein CFOL_v3_23083 [Cephalotus follicularis]
MSDPKNPGLITHTSVFILKILTLADWRQNPHYFKQFTASFDLPIYNYFDYMDAWKNTFLFQNNEDRHSWFFCFDKTFKKQNIPFWFVDWWCFYGPIEEILPPPIIEAYNTFTKHSESLTLCPTTLSFFIHCKLSWIMYWDYIIEESPQTIPTLHRQFWTKWWNKYDLSKCTSETILRSLKSKSYQDQQFTLAKSQIQATIASSSTKKELQEQIKKLQDALDNTPDEDDDKQNTPSEDDEDGSRNSTINLADPDDFLPVQKTKGKKK